MASRSYTRSLEEIRKVIDIAVEGSWAATEGRILLDRIDELEEALRDADNHLQYIYPALDEVRQVEITAKIRRTALRVGQDRIRAALKGN